MNRILHNFVATTALVIFALTAFVRAELQVVDDRLNILSHRIAGKWIQNEGLSKELWGKEELTEKEMRVIELKKDDAALKEIPEQMKKLLTQDGSKIYFAGWLIIGDSRHPCVLRQDHGNTCLTFFTDEGVDSINIMMAVGSSTKVDQLFLGGRYTSQGTLPYYAYRREIKEAEQAAPRNR